MSVALGSAIARLLPTTQPMAPASTATASRMEMRLTGLRCQGSSSVSDPASDGSPTALGWVTSGSIVALTFRSFPRPSAKNTVMSTPISIPKLGVSMTEGTLVEWLVADGDAVQVGDILYRVETDKVENEIESPVAGVVRITGEEGETYDVGTQIGTIE
jgi:biotin carboxyl carrier protein